MFGFLKRAVLKEHMKLVYQNNLAAHFIAIFDPELANVARSQVESLYIFWSPGKEIPNPIAKSVLNTNIRLRRAYDQTAAKYGKSFDEAFKPIMGWDQYFRDHLP